MTNAPTTVDEPPSRYHRRLGSHAPALNRLAAGAACGAIVGLFVGLFLPWQLAVLSGWDATAALIVAVVWHAFGRADADRTAELVRREDETRETALLLVASASAVSLVGVAFALHRANERSSDLRLLLVSLALLTVLASWLLVNTVFTEQYAHLYWIDEVGGIDFGPAAEPDFRDFAYLAFTIGMTYQVSDTALQSRTMRRAVLRQSLLSYVFGVVIIAATINLIAGYL